MNGYYNPRKFSNDANQPITELRHNSEEVIDIL
jgi:hypothetical protein